MSSRYMGAIDPAVLGERGRLEFGDGRLLGVDVEVGVGSALLGTHVRIEVEAVDRGVRCWFVRRRCARVPLDRSMTVGREWCGAGVIGTCPGRHSHVDSGGIGLWL